MTDPYYRRLTSLEDVDFLQHHLRERGLRVTGNKPELRLRLVDALRSEGLQGQTQQPIPAIPAPAQPGHHGNAHYLAQGAAVIRPAGAPVGYVHGQPANGIMAAQPPRPMACMPYTAPYHQPIGSHQPMGSHRPMGIHHPMGIHRPMGYPAHAYPNQNPHPHQPHAYWSVHQAPTVRQPSGSPARYQYGNQPANRHEAQQPHHESSHTVTSAIAKATTGVAKVKAEPGTEMVWEKQPMPGVDVWIPLADGDSAALDTNEVWTNSEGIQLNAVNQSAVRPDGLVLRLRRAVKGSNPLSKLPHSCWPAVIGLVRTGFNVAEAVDGVKQCGADEEAAQVFLVERRENCDEAIQIALAQNASKEQYELDEAARKAKKLAERDIVDLFSQHEYSKSLVLAVFRTRPHLKEAVYSRLDVRRPLHNILDWEVKCRHWYAGSTDYFRALAGQVEHNHVDLAALLAEADSTITKEVTAIPEVAGATPAIFRGPPSRAKATAPAASADEVLDDDITIMHTPMRSSQRDGDPIESDDEVVVVATRTKQSMRASVPVISLDD